MNQYKERDTVITEPAHTGKFNFPDPIDSLMSFRAMSRSNSRPKTSQEVSNLSRLARKYQRDTEINDATYEIKEFENRNGLNKNFLQKSKIQMPEGVDLDMVSDLDVRMKKKSDVSDREKSSNNKNYYKSHVKRFASTSRHFHSSPGSPYVPRKSKEELFIPYMDKTGHKGMHYKCPACNPQPGDIEKEKSSTIHIPKGGCHWQLLDGPELPKTTLIPKKIFQSSRPFLYPARHIGQPGIQLLVDDLVEIREHDRDLYEKRVAKLRQKDKEMYDSTIRNRVMLNNEQMHRMHLKTMDLERRSGQLEVASRLSYRPPPPKKATPTDPNDLEALATLKKYDDALWSDYQYRKKNDAVSQLMVQENAQQNRSATKTLNE